MEKPISNGLKTIFLIHAIVSAILGLGLWIVPGRFLTLLGWVPEWIIMVENELQLPGTMLVDSVITRLLGAALLAFAYSGFRGWRMSSWGEVALVVQMEVIFCVLSVFGMIWGLFRMGRVTPVIGYIMVVLMVGFAVAWFWALRTHAKE